MTPAETLIHAIIDEGHVPDERQLRTALDEVARDCTRQRALADMLASAMVEAGDGIHERLVKRGHRPPSGAYCLTCHDLALVLFGDALAAYHAGR